MSIWLLSAQVRPDSHGLRQGSPGVPPFKRMSVSEAKSVFQALDTNGDGELDPKELQCRLSDFGVEVRVLLAPAALRHPRAV